MGGTLATFMGYDVVSSTVRRSWGIEPDSATVVLQLREFPVGWQVLIPNTGQQQRPPLLAGEQVDVDLVRGATPRVDPPERRALAVVGDLVYGELVEDVGVWGPHKIERMFVRSAEADAATGTVTVVCSDERAFWHRGAMRRWSFNRLRGDGTYAEDTLVRQQQGDPGSPVTLAQIVRFWVAPQLWGQPKVARLPAAWEGLVLPIEFPRYCAPGEALKILQERFRCRVVLHWDRSVGIYLEGEGRLGHSPAADPSNPDALADLVMIDADTRELPYPPDHVLVVGGLRVATTAIDCWEPVLDLDGDVVPLEVGVARLLRGADPASDVRREIALLQQQLRDAREVPSDQSPASAEQQVATQREIDRLKKVARDLERDLRATPEEMDRIHRFVFRTGATQSAADMSPKAIKIFQEQAYRLWRLPGAETYNRHLLPLRTRAEADRAGHPLPILVETYRCRIRFAPLRSTRPEDLPTTTQGQQAPEQVTRELERLRALLDNTTDPDERKRIEAQMAQLRALTPETPRFETESDRRLRAARAAYNAEKKLTDEVLSVTSTLAGGLGSVAGEALGQGDVYHDGTPRMLGYLTRKLDDSPVDDHEVGLVGMREGVRRWVNELERIDRLGGEQGRRYQDAYQKLLEAEAAVAAERGEFYSKDLEFEIARELFAAAKEEFGVLRKSEEEIQANPHLARAFELAKQRAERVLADRRRTRDQRTGVEPDLALIAHLVNDPRSPDPSATVYSELLGVVRTPEVAGHAQDTGVPSLEATGLRPMPVRVTFGTALRPRVPGYPIPTGTSKCQDILPPSVLSDEEAYFAVAFRRRGNGAVGLVDLVEVPDGDALVAHADELQERIFLTGDSNRVAMTTAAEAVAVERVRGDDMVRGQRRKYLRPWLVNPNGIVSGCEIRTRPGLLGCETEVVVGGRSEPFNQLRTRTRPRADLPKQAPRAEDPR